MNTVEKGDLLEARIYDYFQKWISDGNFFAKPECCRIYRKKAYYSKSRDANIIFDIAIEIFMPGSEEVSLLCIIECKNVVEPVPVSDVELLLSRMQQISGGNVKGVLATTAAFQSGAFKLAQSSGIGLLRCFDNSVFQWDLKRSPSGSGFGKFLYGPTSNVLSAILSPVYRSERYEFYCYRGDVGTNSIREFLSSIVRDALKDSADEILALSVDEGRRVEYVSDDKIERLSADVLSEVGSLRGGVALERICQWQAQVSGLVLVSRPPDVEERSSGILGRLSFDPLVLTVLDHGQHDIERRRFTLAHELGHHFLQHGRFMRAEYCKESDLDAERLRPTRNLEVGDVWRMEIQANKFASALLLPMGPLMVDLRQIAKDFDLRNKGHGIIYLDDQNCNIADFMRVTDRLRVMYGVSRSAISFRLQQLGVMTDASRNRRR